MKLSLNLFSINLLYDSLIYCGRLQKKTNCGYFVGNWVQNLIFIIFPLLDGGGLFWTIGKINLFNSLVEILKFLCSKTLIAISKDFKTLCFLITDMNKIGTSLKGAILSLIFFSYLVVSNLSFSIRSHLLIRITIPLLFRWASQNIFCTWVSKSLVASTKSKITLLLSIDLTALKTEKNSKSSFTFFFTSYTCCIN